MANHNTKLELTWIGKENPAEADRPAFSNTNIAKAIKTCRTLFP